MVRCVLLLIAEKIVVADPKKDWSPTNKDTPPPYADEDVKADAIDDA
jgi:hypothetical protein